MEDEGKLRDVGCLPSVLPPSLLDRSLPLLAIIAQKLEVSPVLKWSCTVASKQEKQGHSNVWHEIERQQDDKLCDLAKGERRVLRRARRSSKPADGIVQGVFGDGAVLTN